MSSLESAPATSYPGRPYDQAAPYDWELEGVFGNDERAARSYSAVLGGLKDMALAGVAVVATTMALMHVAYEIKKDFFAIDARDVPVRLPPAVEDEAASAVKVKYSAELPEGGSGSGVKIGPGLVLTAGHVVLGDDGSDRIDCKSSYVFNVATPGYDWPDWIMDRQAIRNDSEDIAVLRVEEDYAFAALPTARVAAVQPDKGDPVFFVNYQGGDGPDHYPNEDILTGLSPESASNASGHAAEYAGIVVGREGSRLVVATGQHGYGPAEGRAVDSKPGASGGPVFNRSGGLVGETIATRDEPASSKSVVMEYGVNLPRHEGGVHLSLVQPVTKAILKPLIEGLPESSAC